MHQRGGLSQPGNAHPASLMSSARRIAGVASRLARLATEPGASRIADGAIRLAGPLTQGDLAAMIGCTRQSVNKLLGLFTDDGLIRLERDRIVVLDLEGLNRTAHR